MDALALHTLLALDRAFPRLWRLLEEQIASQVPLSRNEIRLLRQIPAEGAPAGDLARGLGIDPGQLSRLLSRLVRRRLLARTRSGGDARRHRIMMSDRGRLARTAIDHATSAIAERVLGSLSASERRQLRQAAGLIAAFADSLPSGGRSPTLAAKD